MGGENSHIYEFGSFRMDLTERQLLKDARMVSLTPKAFDVLSILVERAGHLVEKETLMQLVWPDSFVEEANVARIIHTLRRVLGDDQNGIKFIETVAKKGYRFIADAKEIGGRRSGQPFRAPESDEEIAPGSTLPRKRRNPATPILIAATVMLATISLGGYYLLFRNSARGSIVNRLAAETLSGEALQNYRQGRLLVERRHDGDYEKGLELFEKAIQLDPNYSNAYAGKADAKVVLFWRSGKLDDISAARSAVKKSLELDPSNSYAHTVHCRIRTTYDWDHVEAEKECRKAIELDPQDHEAHKELAFLLHSLGRESEALAAIDRAIAIDPTSFNKRSRGLILYQSRHYDEAIAQLEQVAQTDPLYKETTRWLLRCFEMKGDHTRALEYYLNLKSQSGSRPEEIDAIREAFAQGGWPAVLRTMTDGQNTATIFQAGIFAELGDRDKAFEVLDEMLKKPAVMLVTIAREPTLDSLRDDPRFENILKRIRLE